MDAWPRKMFLNLDEDGFGHGLWHFLHKQFPEPYRYERADAGLPVPPSSPLLRCVRLQPVRPAHRFAASAKLADGFDWRWFPFHSRTEFDPSRAEFFRIVFSDHWVIELTRWINALRMTVTL